VSIQGKEYRTYKRLRQSQPELNNWIYATQRRRKEKALAPSWFFYFYNDIVAGGSVGTRATGEGRHLRIEGTDASGFWWTRGHRPVRAATRTRSRSCGPLPRRRRADRRRTHGDLSRAARTLLLLAPRVYETEGWYDIVDGGAPATGLQLKILPDKPAGGWVARTLGRHPRPRPRDDARARPPGRSNPYWNSPDKLQDKAVSRKPKKAGQNRRS